MLTTFDLPNSNLVLTDFPYESGVLTITSPIGTTVYQNTDYASPDFTGSGDIFTTPLPISATNGQPIQGVYQISVTKATSPHLNTQFAPKLASSGTYAATIGVFQNCAASTAIVSYTSNIPPTATLVSTTWQITDPSGNITTETTPQFTIDPIESGTYQIGLTIVFYVTENIGGNEANTKYQVYAAYKYVNSCGNGQSLLCNSLYCCLKKAFYEFINQPSTNTLYAMAAITAASVLIMLANSCGKTDSVDIFNTLNTEYNCSGDCDCGCS